MTNDKDCAALLPCPFCGGDAVMRRDDDPGYPWYVTFEHEPDCTMYALPTDMFRSFSTEAEAIAAWNRRAALQSHGQAFDAAGVREACAKVAENELVDVYEDSPEIDTVCNSVVREIVNNIRALPIPASVEPVAGDVRRLVIAAREAWEELEASGNSTIITIGLDKALESFSSRVPYENEPDTIGSHFGNGGGLDPVVGSGVGVIPDGALDAILGIERDADNDAEFMSVWLQLEARGYLWSESNVNKAHLGWMLARAVPPSPGFGGGDLREALRAAIEWIDAIPPEIVASLPVMPGFDRDWLDEIAALPPVKQSVAQGRPYPNLLTADEAKALLSRAEELWKDLQKNNLGGFSGINRPFWVLHEFKSIIEEFGCRDVGLRWSKDDLDAHPDKPDDQRGGAGE